MNATLVPGGGGIFEVYVNGHQLWSNQKLGVYGFPEHQDILIGIGEYV